MKLAIVAHYDPDNIWDPNFIELLRTINEVTEHTIVVTTNEDIEDPPFELINTMLIRRPNVGYDFYSYRVGAYLALSQFSSVSGLFFINSSLLLLDSSRFKNLLEELSRTDIFCSVRGVTESWQISWHLQSYLIYFELGSLPSGWVQDFFNKIEPVNDKFEVVVKYEIGLSSALLRSNILAEAVFKPSPLRLFMGSIAVLKSRLRRDGLMSSLRSKFWGVWKEINWTHFAADLLALKFGIVKAEFLRTNPHQLPEHAVWDTCSKKLRETVENAIGRTRKNYIISKSGLTESRNFHDPLGIIKQLITTSRYQVLNTKIAVVIHLYYVDLMEEIFEDLANILEPFDLYVTTPFEADLPDIINEAERRKQPLTVVLTKNSGRDVGPFIALYRTGKLDHYDAVLKLHSKKSSYSEKGDFWRRELIVPLCGDSLTVLRSLSLIRESGCGIVGPRRYFLTNPIFWGANKDSLAAILNSCGITVESPPPLYFFAGTMFWFSPKALQAIHLCKGSSISFEAEGGKQDGTLAHAWERAFCILSKQLGYSISAIEAEGIDLSLVNNLENKIPVLNLDSQEK